MEDLFTLVAKVLAPVKHYIDVKWFALLSILLIFPLGFSIGTSGSTLVLALALAFVLHPPVSVGLLLAGLIWHHEYRLRLARAANNRAETRLVKKAFRSYVRLMRGRSLAETVAARSLLVAHGIVGALASRETSTQGVNAFGSLQGARAFSDTALQNRRLLALCAFVLASTENDPQQTSQRREIGRFIEHLPDRVHTKVLDAVVYAAFNYRSKNLPSSGYLSTLATLYQAHFIGSLPENRQRHLTQCVERLGLDFALLGWLSFRLVDVVLNHVILRNLTTPIVLSDVGSLARMIEARLRQAEQGMHYDIQWKARRLLLEECGWHDQV